jgi:hypothetical protein
MDRETAMEYTNGPTVRDMMENLLKACVREKESIITKMVMSLKGHGKITKNTVLACTGTNFQGERRPLYMKMEN